MLARSSEGRVTGLSTHAKHWLGPAMVRKGKKRAAAPVNSQKKRRKKGYVDCWDVLESLPALDGLSRNRNATSAGRSAVFLKASAFRAIMINVSGLVPSCTTIDVDL